MLMQLNPNSWSCLPAAFAMALGASVEELINEIGDDGSAITHAGLADPLCRRGFHPQQLIKTCLDRGLAVTEIQLFPQSVPNSTSQPQQVGSTDWGWFQRSIYNTRGVINCRTNIGRGHAMAYVGMGYYALVFDPATGDRFEFETLDDTEKRGMYVVGLWRLDNIIA